MFLEIANVSKEISVVVRNCRNSCKVEQNLLLYFGEDPNMVVALILLYDTSEIRLVSATANNAHQRAFSACCNLASCQSQLSGSCDDIWTMLVACVSNALNRRMNVGLQW